MGHQDVKNEGKLPGAGEGRISAIMDNISEAIMSWDSAWRFTYVNPEAARMLGVEREDLLGRDARSICQEFDGGFCRQFEQAMAGQVPVSFEEYSVPLSMWLEVRMFPSDGGVSVFFRNITERKEAEHSLKRAHDDFREIFNAMKDDVYIVDSHYEIRYSNPALEREFGPIEGRKCYEYFHDRTDVCPWCKNQQVFAGQSVHWGWSSAKTGKTYDLFDTPFKNEDGTVSKLEVFHDVTEHKRTENALKESEARFRALIEQGGDGFELLDESGRYVDLNNATCRQLGYSREELLGMSIPDIDPLFDLGRFKAKFHSLVEGGMPATFETVHQRKDKTTFPVEITASAICLGNTWYALSQVRDITERKQADELRLKMEQEKQRLKTELQMQQTQRLESLGVLAGGIAHDFNNILTVILGNADLALNDLSPTDPARDSLQRIVTASHRAAGLCRQMLAYAGRGR